MSKKKSHAARDKPMQSRSVGLMLDNWDKISCWGYTRLADNPEVQTAVNRIAEMISTMPIHLMENSPDGNVRVVNQLSRRLDIEPNPYMTRKTLMYNAVRTMLLDGNGNAVLYPKTRNGLLESLEPISPYRVGFRHTTGTYGYEILIDGIPHDPENLVHFVENPDPDQPWMGMGFRASLKNVVKNLQQAAETKNAFMASKWKPSVIIRVDGNSEELTSEAGRDRLLEKYVETSEAGKPWMLPSEYFEVTQVKPLSLNDLALADGVKLDKQAVAAILSVPPFVVGAGGYNQQEWNHFIATRILPIVRGMEQELTRKLILKPEWFIRMNPWALYAYDLKTLADIGQNLYVRGIMDGNEVRGWVNLEPREGLDNLVILENYIPRDMVGNQKKLEGGSE